MASVKRAPQRTLDGAPEPEPEGRLWRCSRCWCSFEEGQLTVVQERFGKGFRCKNCVLAEELGL